MTALILQVGILALLCQTLWCFNELAVARSVRQRYQHCHPSHNFGPFSSNSKIPYARSYRPIGSGLWKVSIAAGSDSSSPSEDQPPLLNFTQVPAQNNVTEHNNTLLTEQQRNAMAEAAELRERARKLREEALAEESLLKESRSSQQRQRIQESEGMIDRLFRNVGMVPANSTIFLAVERHVASVLRSERWSPQQVLMVLERLQTRQIRVQEQPAILTPSQAAVRPPNFQIGDTRNAARANQTEWKVLDGWIACLISAASCLDDEYNNKMTTAGGSKQNQSGSEAQSYNSRWTGRVAATLKTRRKEMIRAEEEELRRKIAVNVNAVVQASKAASENYVKPGTVIADDIQEYTRQTLGIPSEDRAKEGRRLNVTRLVEQVQAVPMWVPASLLPILVKSRATLRKEDVNVIKDRVLVGTRFFCTSSDAIPSAAIFRGNIRTSVGLVDVAALENDNSNQTALVFDEIQQRLEAQGLHERVQLFMLEDPEWRPEKDNRVPKAPPVLLAISRKVEPVEGVMEKAVSSKVAKRISLALTMLTTFSFALSCYALNPIFFDAAINQKDATVLLHCLPLMLGVLSIQVFHEAAHYLVAKLRKIKIGRPTLLPSPQIGTFGCITPLLSFPSNRVALFDLAFSGPVAALAASVLFLLMGAHATIHASDIVLQSFPVVPAGLLKSSFLTSVLLSVAAPKLMLLPSAQPVPIHPLLLSGFTGMMSSALNLLPVFRLDGGRLIATLFGPRLAGVTSASTLLFMLSLVISGSSGIALTWGLLIVFLQRRTEVPVRDDVTPVDDYRFGAWVGAVTTAILTLAPFPGGPGFL